MANPFDEKNFGESSEMSSQTVDWGQVGDFILGTFVKARHGVQTQYGENSIYEFVVERGSFHKLTKKKPAAEATAMLKGEIWNVWGRNDIFNGMLNSLRPGQIVKLVYSEEKETKMGMSKIVKIIAPKTNEGKPTMNEEWLKAQGVVSEADF